MGVLASAALSGTDMDPSGGFVDGAGETGCFDEGFDQHGGDTVAVVPVLGELTGESLEQMRDEVGQSNPASPDRPDLEELEEFEDAERERLERTLKAITLTGNAEQVRAKIA